VLSLFNRGKAILGLAVCAALALGLSACGSDTVTVTETVQAGAPSGQEEGNQPDPGDISTENAVAGYVDSVKVESDSIVLTGWAAASDFSEAATRVEAMVGGETVAQAVPTIEREDVVEVLGEPGVSKSGFELKVPLDSVECGTPAAGIEVVGSLDGESGVISYGEGITKEVTNAC
jgi:hypothetical protein